EADQDRDGGPVHAAEGQPARDLARHEDDESDQREGCDQSVVGGGFFENLEHGGHSASVRRGLSCSRGADSGSSSERSARLMAEITPAHTATVATADNTATGPPRRAATMSCCAAIATTTGMYRAPQYSTPSSVSLGRMCFLCMWRRATMSSSIAMPTPPTLVLTPSAWPS